MIRSVIYGGCQSFKHVVGLVCGSELYHSMFWNAPVFFFSFCDTLANLQISLSLFFFLHCFLKMPCGEGWEDVFIDPGKMLMVKLGQPTTGQRIPPPSGLGKGLSWCVGSQAQQVPAPLGEGPSEEWQLLAVREKHTGVGVPHSVLGPKGLAGSAEILSVSALCMAPSQVYGAPCSAGLFETHCLETPKHWIRFFHSPSSLAFICYRRTQMSERWSSPEALSFLSDGPICFMNAFPK